MKSFFKDTEWGVGFVLELVLEVVFYIFIALLSGCGNGEVSRPDKVAGADAKEVQTASLFEAARAGDEEKLKELLAAGADINARDSKGSTLLYWTFEDDDIEVFKLLLRNGIDVNAPNKDGQTPLHVLLDRFYHERVWGRGWRYYRNRDKMVQKLVQHVMEINIADNYGFTALDYAVIRGKDDAADFIRKHGGRLSDAYRLVLAVRAGDAAKVRELLERGANPNQRDKDHNLAVLHIASQGHHADVLKVLVSAGADVNVTDNDGGTPLHVANTKEVAQVLIDGGADLEARQKDGRTPLFFTAKDIAELLISAGASVNATDNDSRTPLHEAADRADKNTVKLLLTKGADVNTPDNRGQTPLFEVGPGGSPQAKTVEILVANGADVDATDIKGRTALHNIMPRKLPPYAGPGAIGRVRDEYYLATVKAIVAAGASVNIRDNEGKTPLDLAEEENCECIIDFLRKHGAVSGEELKRSEEKRD